MLLWCTRETDNRETNATNSDEALIEVFTRLTTVAPWHIHHYPGPHPPARIDIPLERGSREGKAQPEKEHKAAGQNMAAEGEQKMNQPQNAYDGNLTHLPIRPPGFKGGDSPVLPGPGSQHGNKLYRRDETTQLAWACRGHHDSLS